MLVLAEYFRQLRQCQLERRLQGVGRIDDEHAASGQARANDVARFIGRQFA